MRGVGQGMQVPTEYDKISANAAGTESFAEFDTRFNFPQEIKKLADVPGEEIITNYGLIVRYGTVSLEENYPFDSVRKVDGELIYHATQQYTMPSWWDSTKQHAKFVTAHVSDKVHFFVEARATNGGVIFNSYSNIYNQQTGNFFVENAEKSFSYVFIEWQ